MWLNSIDVVNFRGGKTKLDIFSVRLIAFDMISFNGSTRVGSGGNGDS